MEERGGLVPEEGGAARRLELQGIDFTTLRKFCGGYFRPGKHKLVVQGMKIK